MEHEEHGQQQHRIIQLAQYLSRLTVQQDVWIEVGKALVNLLDVDLVAFGKCHEDGAVVVRDWSFSAHVVQNMDPESLINAAVAEVMESGFLTWRLLHRPEPLPVAFLPITQEHQIIAVMLVGHRVSESALKEMLDIYLAVAGLVGVTVTRLASERELKQHRQHLEELVQARTAELLKTNEMLQQEVLQRTHAEEALLAEKDNLIKILEAMEDMVYIVSPDHDIKYANHAFLKEFTFRKDRKCYQLIHGREQACHWCNIKDIFMGKTGRSEWYCTKNGKTYDIIETLLKNTDDSLSILTIFRDITERKQTEEIIKQMAYHDALTRLPNRMLFSDRLHLEIARTRRHQQKLALMMLDLDHFKEVNDTLGHDVGDQLLQAVSARLTSSVRENDTVARLGGDEFALILPEIARVEDAVRIADKIIESFQNPLALRHHELRVTPSMGIALYPDDGEQEETLMKKADIALYHVKRTGRNRYQIAE
ncbi:MAG: diguanylate cyclase [Candidatus Competibacteraceae bacterium]|nr:diguanylate cyclase [Candidatus Competibacteraceae bacterium]